MPHDAQKVVVAMLDGTRRRGLIHRFRQFGDGFDLSATNDPEGANAEHVSFLACKAVYFVKSHEGNKLYRENKTMLPPVHRDGQKVEVVFKDGEVLVGTTMGFNPKRSGFVMYPADAKSNNVELFVVTENVERVKIIGGGLGGSDKIFSPASTEGVFLPEKRLEAVQRVMRGETPESVAKDMMIKAETILAWRARYMASGPAGLGIE